jgi:histidinol-phosphatase (PHP family)
MGKGLVSIHGGHSGEFCNHATDSLIDIIKTYIKKDFKWVGITEHIPPVNDQFLYEDEIENSLTSKTIKEKFNNYHILLSKLKEDFKEDIKIYKSIETDYYTGAVEHINDLKSIYDFDYILGSIHFVNDIPFDYSIKYYQDAVLDNKGIDNLYLRYFEEQFEMLNMVKPEAVAHFDLIRIFDEDYKSRIKKKEIWKKIERNLEFISQNNMVLDFNLRALKKGADEPYPSYYILMLAKEMGIKVYPGDDSHSINDIGNFLNEAKEILEKYGFDTTWKYPFD